jgi:hypothetical protein
MACQLRAYHGKWNPRKTRLSRLRYGLLDSTAEARCLGLQHYEMTNRSEGQNQMDVPFNLRKPGQMGKATS